MRSFSIVPRNTSLATTGGSEVFHEYFSASASTMINDVDDPLDLYFTAPDGIMPYILDVLLSDPPSVHSVVRQVLKRPGCKAQDRAVSLLGRMSARTLQFAIQFGENERYMRPVYSNEVWEIVFLALGSVDDPFGAFCHRWVATEVHSDNPVKRLAAFDALEMLSETFGDAAAASAAG